MTEKYKIYLSEDTKTRLVNDAEIFEFLKKDGAVNLNAFLKTLIVNFFEQYRHDSEDLLQNIMLDLNSIATISASKAEDFANKIVNTYIKNRQVQNKSTFALTLTVSGPSYDIINIIENNMLKNSSLSQYLKDMFGAYLSIPRSERESIIFRDTYADIERAIKEQKILSFKATTSGERTTYFVEPYIIAQSKEEQCNYLLCIDKKSNKPRTFRISRLRNVFVSSDNYIKDKAIQDELMEKAKRSPHSLSDNIHAVVRLTDIGVRAYKGITKNRPTVTSINGDLYSFDWPEKLLEEYFKRFGCNALVIEPDSLRKSMRDFYYSGLRIYDEE